MLRKIAAAASLVHLLLLPAYAQLGAIRPWRAADEVFAGDRLAWRLMLLSALLAPVLAGTALALIARNLSGRYRWYRERVRDPALAILGGLAAMSLVNAALVAEAAWRVRLALLLSESSPHVVLPLLALGALCVASLAHPSVSARIAALTERGLLVLAPFAAFSFLGLLYLAATLSPPEKSDAIVAGSDTGDGRIVMLLFDALSYDAIFDASGVVAGLPNLAALVDESVVVADYRASAGGTTRHNIPILLTGQRYEGNPVFEPGAGPIARRADGGTVPLRAQRNLFDVVASHGFEVFVVGAYLRYCSTYVREHGYCESTAFQYPLVGATPLRALLAPYWLSALSVLPHAAEVRLRGLAGPHVGDLLDESVGLRRELAGLHRRVKEKSRGPGRRFVYAHYPLPHHPYLSYVPSRATFEPARRYRQSVRAVDRIVGELRAGLEAAGLWDATLFVLVSDHPLSRAGSGEGARVPLILKPPRGVGWQGDEPADHSELLAAMDEFLAIWRGTLEASD